MWSLWKIKARRYVRLWWQTVLHDTLAPLFDKREFFRLLSLPISLLLIFLTSGEEAMEMEAWSIGKVGAALLLTIPLWFALNLVLAPFRVWKEEKEKGKWFERRFVYHSPRHVFTTLVGPDDDGKSINFVVEDAEPNTMVKFKIEYDGGLAKAQIGFSTLAVNPEGITRETQ